MSKRHVKERILQTEITTISENGKTKEEKSTRKILLAREPDYIKLYVNTLLAFKDLPKQMNALLIELLNIMTFANKEAKHGGQLIILNMFVKNEICERLGIRMSTFKNALTNLTKSGILKRVGNSTYQANPNMFGRGEWLDIKSIRATFDFNAGTVEAEIQTEEDH
jgi:hypothetical protein